MQVGPRWLCACAVIMGCGDDGGSTVQDARPPDAIGYSILEAYGEAWAEPDPTIRGRLLEYSATPALVVYEPTRTLASRDAVDGAMAQFLTEYPGGSVPLVGNIREHGNRVWLKWDARTGNNTSLGVGFDLMKRATDMRLERIHSFFGQLPGIPSANNAVQQALVDAWNESDANARLTLLETAVTIDVVLSFDGATSLVMGRDALSAAIGDAHAAAPGRVTALTSGYLSLPLVWHVAWRTTAADNTTVLGTGVTFAILAADGRIGELVYFNGTTP